MYSVLIVEDEQAIHSLLKSEFIKEGFSVSVAINAKEALSVLSPAPDIIILDIMLPGGKNGFDLLEELKHNPGYSNIPVMVLTNLATEETTARLMGASDYILKADTPIRTVIERVKTLISKT